MKIAIKRILLILITSATFVACNYDDNGNVPAIMFNPGCAMEPVFAFDGGSEDYLFMTSYSWTATPADDWVSITPASGTKDENTFTITVEPNPLGEDRTSSVEVKLSTGKRVTIPITQQMHPVYESESSPLIALSAENAQRDIAIRTNQKFHITIARDAIWLSVRATRSVEDNVLHLTATDNLTTSSRFTTVYVLNDESELLERFDVVQASKLPALNEVVYRTNDKSLVKIGMGEGYGSRFLAHLYDEERDCGRIIFDYVVRTIPENAFKDCSNITSFELPANLTMIGAGASVVVVVVASLHYHHRLKSSAKVLSMAVKVNSQQIVTYLTRAVLQASPTIGSMARSFRRSTLTVISARERSLTTTCWKRCFLAPMSITSTTVPLRTATTSQQFISTALPSGVT